jgi:hypothetical protein
MKKVKKQKKAKLKKREQVRAYLEEVNHHCAQLSTVLRALADKLDDVRSHHFDK